MSDKTQSLVHQLRDALEDDIVDGRLQPGEHLDVVSVAERFEVSRTPAREALQLLAASGLVDVVPKRGAFVAQRSLPQLIEMFEVMAELEGMCARLAARRITDAETVELNDSLEACRKAAEDGDSDAYYYENERFHNVIYQASHNNFLVQQTRQINIRLKPYRRLQLKVRNRVRKSLEEHNAVVEAILAGNEALAEEQIKQHVLIQGERFTDFVASVTALSAAANDKKTADTSSLA